MYITVAIVDEHLAIRERTSSPLLVYYTAAYIHYSAHKEVCIAYSSMLCRRGYMIFRNILTVLNSDRQ